MSVCVRRPGLFTTVQDSGRWGYQHVGVPVAGAMDMVSHRLANAIVGNEPSAATLEITLVGPELECDRATLFAVTGAEFDVRLDGVDVAANTSCLARSGQVIAFGRRRSGARGYLSVKGGGRCAICAREPVNPCGESDGWLRGACTPGRRLSRCCRGRRQICARGNPARSRLPYAEGRRAGAGDRRTAHQDT